MKSIVGSMIQTPFEKSEATESFQGKVRVMMTWEYQYYVFPGSAWTKEVSVISSNDLQEWGTMKLIYQTYRGKDYWDIGKLALGKQRMKFSFKVKEQTGKKTRFKFSFAYKRDVDKPGIATGLVSSQSGFTNAGKLEMRFHELRWLDFRPTLNRYLMSRGLGMEGNQFYDRLGEGRVAFYSALQTPTKLREHSVILGVVFFIASDFCNFFCDVMELGVQSNGCWYVENIRSILCGCDLEPNAPTVWTEDQSTFWACLTIFSTKAPYSPLPCNLLRTAGDLCLHVNDAFQVYSIDMLAISAFPRRHQIRVLGAIYPGLPKDAQSRASILGRILKSIGKSGVHNAVPFTSLNQHPELKRHEAKYLPEGPTTSNNQGWLILIAGRGGKAGTGRCSCANKLVPNGFLGNEFVRNGLDGNENGLGNNELVGHSDATPSETGSFELARRYRSRVSCIQRLLPAQQSVVAREIWAARAGLYIYLHRTFEGGLTASSSRK
ncbi:uncharacterized protein BDR25DRAFT_353706 [Lindgomyces ingoldianus]|uniref:Uncharacterized protein n=1 Tax=Lindgomyces ingoldianus TaxID=673940 RepID=A0ACB6R0T1_9PLEO|nr:uncharacterized protein BDR25DRAFT_353706 [Lindgomyces ingoldianus]KAF2471935.1 hypothetical protein BDR25DRAFT_353706 [Lindgomyces ingoldianus]